MPCDDVLSTVGGDYDYMDADIFYDMLDINVYYEEYEINNANNMIKTDSLVSNTDYIIDNDIVYITLTTDKYQYIENLKDLMSFSVININLPSIEDKYNTEIHVFLNFNEITPTQTINNIMFGTYYISYPYEDFVFRENHVYELIYKNSGFNWVLEIKDYIDKTPI